MIRALFSLYRSSPFWIRNALGSLTWPLRIAMQPMSTIRVGGYRMRLNFLDNASFKYYTDRDRYEYEELSEFLSTVARNPGSVVVDVGANYGAFSLTTASTLGRARIFQKILAIEPDPRAFGALQRSIELNDLQSLVVACQAIASDSSGEQTLFQNARSSADNRTHAVRSAPIRVRRTTTVRAVSIDELLREQGLDSAAQYIVKMDIQGNEGRALRGMEQTLRRARGFALFLEHFPYLIESAGVNIAEYHTYLRSLGADELWEFTDSGVRRLDGFSEFEARTRALQAQTEQHLQGAGTNVLLVRGMTFVPSDRM